MQFYTVTILKGEKKIEITGSQTTDGFPIAPGGTLSQVIRRETVIFWLLNS